MQRRLGGRWLWIVAAALPGALFYAPDAAADPPAKNVGVIERVVAVVGHHAIFLSELRKRMAPYIKRVDAESDAARRAAAHAEVEKDVCDAMINEILIAAAAAKLRLIVAPDEIDAAIKTVADQAKLSVPDLLKAAREQGYSDADYRDEMRRQLFEGKLIYILVRQQIKGFSALSQAAQGETMNRTRQKMLDDLRQKTFIEKRL